MKDWFLDDQIVNILKVGLSGFAFLVLLMSYFLLKSEQKREGEARTNVLKSIQRFTYVSILFVVIVGGFSILELFVSPTTSTTPRCTEKLKRMVKLADSENHTIKSLRELIKNSTDCIKKKESNYD